MMFGLLIQAYREAAKLSVRQLAKQIGVEHSKLWRFENGKQIESNSISKILTWALTPGSVQQPTKGK